MAASMAALDIASMPRYRRYFEHGQTLFLSLVTAERRPWLSDDAAKAIALIALREARRHYPFVHHGHVLLNDHLHLMLSPVTGVAIPDLVGSFKRAVLARLSCESHGHGNRLWQRRYYDHVVRDSDDFARHLDYLHFNPVKHGLVLDAGSWRWSSLATWQARGGYPSDWGRLEPKDMPADVGE